MEPNTEISLDEQLESVINAKKSPWWRKLLSVVVFAAIALSAYVYRDNLAALISRKPASASADANSAQADGNAGRRGGRGGGRGGGAAVVTVLPARKGDLPVYLHGLGSVAPYTSVAVKSRVDGQMIRTTFQEGQFVREGELLAELDRRPFEVQLSQAEGQLAQAKGQLARDTALLQSAKVESDRNQLLLDKGLIPKQQFDIQAATVSQYQGSVQADQAAIEVANAAIANANLQITYTRITAPVSGRIGLRQIDAGNIIRAADPGGLAVIAQVQPIAVLFNIPEDDLGPVLKKLRAGANLRVDAYDRDDMTKLASGRLATVDNQIDQSTGTSRLKAVFNNDDNALFPNQFVNVHLLLDVINGATIVSAAAIQRGPQGTYVFVVDDNKKAHIRPVTVKQTEENEVAIGDEVKAGELVVVEGTDKIEDNGTVDAQGPGQDPSTASPAKGRGGRRGGRGGTSE